MTVNEAEGGREGEEKPRTTERRTERGEGRCPSERGEVREDGEGRWQRMKLSTHNDPAALYQADKAAWQQMRLHETDPDVVAYQEIWLKGKYNVVCAQMYDKGGRKYQREWAQGLLLLVRRGLSLVQDKKVGARERRAVYDLATEHGKLVIINCHVPHGRRVKEYVAQLRMEYITLGAGFDINVKVEYPKPKRIVFLPSATLAQFFLLVFENLHVLTLSTGDRLRTL